MPADSVNANGSGIRGHVTVWRIDEKTGVRTPVVEKNNQIQVSWGHIAAKQIGFRHQPDRPDYFISGMYFEYENQINPDQIVTVTNFDRTLGLPYYNTLASNPLRDFLRVPLRLEPSLSVSGSSVGAAELTAAAMSNQLTFFAQTAGTAGVHGKSFSHLSNSKVYSAALVAMPVFDDRTRDVIFARINFGTTDQTAKEASSQIGITWDIVFE
jgi:hypothetical protein